MGFAPGFRNSKNQHRGGISVTPDNKLLIKLPSLRVLIIIARSMLLAMVIISTPWLGSLVIGDSSFSLSAAAAYETHIHGELLLSVLLRDLTNEGLFNPGSKALFLSRRDDIDEAQILNSHYGIDFMSESDAERQSSIADGTFDFVFASGFNPGDFIDRSLKIGGIVAIQMSNDAAKSFHQKPTNYKIVYIRKLETTVMAMKKTGPVQNNLPMKRRLFGTSSEAKKAALNGLEDVLLEPPRSASVKKSKKYLKRTKYLPDLIGDSLEEYPRRVFIDVGLPDKDDNGSTKWFALNYPTRNRDFEIYKIETVNEGVLGESVPQMSMSDWLMENVREEEYVVMKAEAEIVEDMVKNRAIQLVDELFLECKHQGLGGRKNKTKRAYWECLALYGRLRDEGVAVHQWWG